VRTVELCRDGNLSIRLLRNDPRDLVQLVSWRAEPHVRDWWDPDEPPPSLQRVRETYVPLTEPWSRTTACVIELDGRPIGYLQFYRWDAYPDEVEEMALPAMDGSFGLDLFIGDPEMVGAGHGTRAVALACAHLARDRGAREVLLTTEVTNGRAQRAYEKVGFVKIKEVWDLDTRGGQRIRSWLMRWRPTAATYERRKSERMRRG
jgi:aminoglycoside 6'-N-acetyltransferase